MDYADPAELTLVQALILGIVQGLTEFLPISSSGHLVFVQQLMKLKGSMLAFDVVIHLGTLLGLFVYYWKDIWLMTRETFIVLLKVWRADDREALYRKYPYALIAGLVVVTSIPTAMIGYAFKDSMEALFSSLFYTGVGWIVIGVILVASKRLQNGDRTLGLMNHFDAFVIGIAQGIAIIPSISRSGATIVAAMALGIEKKEAARFSFLIAIPAILGAGLLEMKDSIDLFQMNSSALIAGFISSAIVGYLSIAFLIRVVQRAQFHLFGLYCIVIGAATLVYLRLT